MGAGRQFIIHQRHHASPFHRVDRECHRLFARQRLVREIKPLATFRDKLNLNGRMVQGDWEGWDQKTLRQWLEAPAPADRLKRLLLVLGGLATLNVALLLLNLVDLLPPWWQLTLGIYFVLYLGLGREASSLFDESMG